MERMSVLAGARRPTIQDVADAAGVSRATASRAMTGQAHVAPPVREKVHEAATRLGYVPDATARQLRQQTSRVIGVLVPDLQNPFYADLAAGVGRSSAPAGLAMLLAHQGGNQRCELDIAEMFVEMRVAGAVVTPTSAE